MLINTENGFMSSINGTDLPITCKTQGKNAARF